MPTKRFDIDLLPLIEILQEAEGLRASRARSDKRKKVKTVPCRFVSVNRMYPVNPRTHGKYLSTEGRHYKEYIVDKLNEAALDDIRFLFKATSFEVSYVFMMTDSMMFTKDRVFREVDVTNMFKAVEDAVFDFLMESDATVLDVHGYKRVTAGDPKVIILISPQELQGTIYHQGKIVAFEELMIDEEVFQCSI